LEEGDKERGGSWVDLKKKACEPGSREGKGGHGWYDKHQELYQTGPVGKKKGMKKLALKTDN